LRKNGINNHEDNSVLLNDVEIQMISSYENLAEEFLSNWFIRLDPSSKFTWGEK